MRRKLPRETRVCSYSKCGQVYECRVDSSQRFCSRRCFYRTKGKLLKVCISCGKSFESYRYENRKYCSRKCAAKVNGAGKRGDKNPAKRPEVRKKISIALKGNICGDKNGMYGKHHTEETKEKQRDAIQKRGGHAGENNPNWQGGPVEVICQYCNERFEVSRNLVGMIKFCSHSCSNKAHCWKGGISNLPYPFGFNEKLKSLIRVRDNNICQLCGKTKEENGKNLCVHHIDYVKENLDPKNLIALCFGCNGTVNFNREHWTKFFHLKLEEVEPEVVLSG